MTTYSALRCEFPEPDIAVVTFDDPDRSANILSRRTLQELAAVLDELLSRPGLAGVVFMSAKPGIFIAGADLREFVALDRPSRAEVVEIATQGRRLFQRLAEMPWVSVAAIDGVCVGGGAELAIWCDRRLMTDSAKAQYGFPEVKLGLFPGWGGTARTPRIVGLANAVELVTGGESIDGRTARAMGLVTDVVASERLLDSARAVIRAEQASGAYRQDRQHWQQPLNITETELAFLGATASAVIQQQTKGQYPAPLAALEVMLGAASVDLESACEQEAAGFADLFGTPINRALLNVFFLTDRNKKDRGLGVGIATAAVVAANVRTVGVFGAGIMGSGIAAACVKRELPVTLTDLSAPALAAGVQKILEEVSYNRTTKQADTARMLKFAPLVRATALETEFAGCDLVLEAVVENRDVKKGLYARLEPLLRPDAILASNTSAISIGALAEGLQHPERFVGIHFFNPVRQMPLVEIIRGPKTSDATVATAVAFAKSVGKSPIVVQDGPGFLVNRLLLPYMNEALLLLEAGVEPSRIEEAAKKFGLPMGPLTLYDVVGIDTAYFAGHVMHDAFPDRIVESRVLSAMVAANRLGQKTGAGFYRYDSDKPGADKKAAKPSRGKSDPALAAVLAPLVTPGPTLTNAQITDRLLLPMLLEATRILAEGKVRDPRDVDLGLIFGIGFPPFRGGLLYWADTIGAAGVVDRLRPYAGLGARYQATPMLAELAAAGRKFYDLSSGDDGGANS